MGRIRGAAQGVCEGYLGGVAELVQHQGKYEGYGLFLAAALYLTYFLKATKSKSRYSENEKLQCI